MWAAVALDSGHQGKGADGRQQGNESAIDEEGKAAIWPTQAPGHQSTHARRSFQLRQSLVNQVKADMAPAFGVTGASVGGAGFTGLGK